ncbi:thiamine pyrophosphate-binding protein [Brevibacterium paucivorans]
MALVAEHRCNAGHAVMRLIRACEIYTVFGIPGSHNLEFYRHLDKPEIRCFSTRHEQGAGYGADGRSQRADKPGAVITTSGPGLLNDWSAVGTSFAESRPLLVLAPGVSRGKGFADNGTLHETKNQLTVVAEIAGPSTRAEPFDEDLEAVHTAFVAFNDGYEEINQNEADRGTAPTGMVLGQPHWKMMIEAFGDTSFALTDETDLESTMEQASGTPGLVLVHVPMNLFRWLFSNV